MSILSSNKTSARLLLDFATRKWETDSKKQDAESERRFLLVLDLYIKARSYALLNKSAFWLAAIFGLMVIVWPSLAILMKDFGFEKEFLKSVIVQTTVTGVTALTFAVYSHYKKRQMYVENLMRHVIYADEVDKSLIERVVKEMERIDSGFGFSEALGKKKSKEPDQPAP